MFYLFKKKKRKVYTELPPINFCGKIENTYNVVVKFPKDPTLFSFSLPAVKKIERYFKGKKYGMFNEEFFSLVARFLKYINIFPENEELERFNFRKSILIDFALRKEEAGSKYPFPMRIGFNKELYPELNIIYTVHHPFFPDYYEEVVSNITGIKDRVEITEDKTKRGWAWEFLKYRGMTHRKKVLIVDIRGEKKEKLKRIIKEKHKNTWFVVFFDELVDISLDQKISLILVADRFIFDTSYYAYFATREGIKSYKIGNLPFPVDPESGLKVVDEKRIEQILQ